jgi:hypothetical protein
MSLDDDAGPTRFALLEGFFRRRDEAGKFYCASCLVAQLRQRGSRAFSLEPDAVESLTRYSYEMSLAWKRYVAPEPTPKAPAPKPQTVEPVDAPEQVALDDEIRF